jgi:Flp pilus assembly protein TadD
MRIFRYFVIAVLLGSLGACAPVAEKPSSKESLLPPLLDSAPEKSGRALREEGRQNYDAGKYELAAESYAGAVKADEGDDAARLGLAESYLKLGQNNKAYDTFQTLMLSKTYAPAVAQGMGLVALQEGNFDAAEKSLKQALDLDKTQWRAWNGLGQVYDFKKQWKDSDDAYHQALKYTNKPYFIYNNMGVSYMAQKDFKKAAEAFQKVLRYKPDLDIAKTNYKLALAMQNRYDEATGDDDVHEEAKALNNAGYAAMQQGDYKQAERLFVKAIEINPSFYKTAYNNLQVLNQLKEKEEQ